MKFFTTLIIFLTICAKVSADFSSAFTASYIATDITSKLNKKINKKIKADHTEVLLSDCYKIKTPPSVFEKDIIIPMETAMYQKKMENAHNDTRFNWKPKFSRCDNEITCNYEIINPYADLANSFILNLIFLFILTNMVCICLCGTDKERSELSGVICGSFCHAVISSLIDDEN